MISSTPLIIIFIGVIIIAILFISIYIKIQKLFFMLSLFTILIILILNSWQYYLYKNTPRSSLGPLNCPIGTYIRHTDILEITCSPYLYPIFQKIAIIIPG